MHIKLSPMAWFAILFGATCILAILIPGTPAALHELQINEAVYRLLVISLLVPYGVIWFAAFYGYDKLHIYSGAVNYTGEGKSFKKIAKGLGVLAWGLILQTLLSLVLGGLVVRNPNLQGMQAIVDHYFSILVALAAFLYIEAGTHQLVELVRARRTQTAILWLILLGAVIGSLFQRLLLVSQTTGNNPYYLSIYPLLFTVIVPYIFTWSLGIISVYELRLYTTRVKGVLYRSALRLLANGLNLVIVFSIAAQYVSAIYTTGGRASLGSVLPLLYALLAIQGFGFGLVAVGAKRLKMIEDV